MTIAEELAKREHDAIVEIARLVFPEADQTNTTYFPPLCERTVERVAALTTEWRERVPPRVPQQQRIEAAIAAREDRRERTEVHHVATAQQVGAAASAAAAAEAAHAGMLTRLALHYLPAGNRPPNGTNDAAVWDYRVSAARELLEQMGANGA